MALLARRLIWRFAIAGGAATGIWHEGQLVDAAGVPLSGLDEAIAVTLWHPLASPPEAVLRWRVWLEENGVVQPFKQAHREVYLLTDPERTTRLYSNRFAAHLLEHYPLHALCRERGWAYTLPRFNHDTRPPARALPGGGRAEFWVEVAGDGDRSDTGVPLYVATDQVRFYRPDGEPQPLAEVDPLLFSEVMRDVDLFVGVAGIGMDPNRADPGLPRAHEAQWQRQAFGELSAAALTRKDLLARLLPRFKIASRCSLEGRFLRVQGDLRGYRIHLGSGNILMEPNDQYLCIVPDRRGAPAETNRVFLPFEGDPTLSLILSKAFLLAEDTQIADPTIADQLRGAT